MIPCRAYAGWYVLEKMGCSALEAVVGLVSHPSNPGPALAGENGITLRQRLP
jgi:hypothetical protein